jgi:hypothetical protein
MLLLVFLLCWIPVGEYAWSLGRSFSEHGISLQTWHHWQEHHAWLMRFFTGPPSDAEMLSFFRQHKQDFDRLAYWHGHCIFYFRGDECTPIETRLGLSSSSEGVAMNASFNPQLPARCRPHCDIQGYQFALRSQNWWRNTNLKIHSWSKLLIYIPPLVPGPMVGLDSSYPTERDEAMRRHCRYPKASLDYPLPELMAAKYYVDGCGYFPLGEGWYLVQKANFSY